MEVLVIHRFNDFHLGLSSLQNPPFLSQIASSLTGIQSVSIAYNFCKWGAVILALVATFGSIISRIKILIIRFRHESHSLTSNSLLSDLDDDDYSATDDDGAYSLPSSEYEEEEDEDSESSSCFTWRRVDEDFQVRGSGHHVDEQLQNGEVRHRRRRSIGEIFSLSEIANSKSVVKLWDSIGFGLGLDFDDSESSSPRGVFSAYDINKEQSNSSISGPKPPAPALSSLSPAVMVSAGENESGNLALQIWDTRLRRRSPAVIAEWEPNLGKIVSVGSGGVEKVYVRDDVGSGVTVGDMRKVRSPLGNVTESDVDTWWDADAVMVSDQSFGDDSVLRRK